jgi:hypothetical protein
VKHDPEAFQLVERELEELVAALLELDENLDQAAPYSEADTDLEWACEHVTAAADALVAAIEAWIPSLVPTPRALDEVLATIASWQPNDHTRRAASSARALFEQLQAESYGESMTNPDEIPDLDEFTEDLRATVETAWEALP